MHCCIYIHYFIILMLSGCIYNIVLQINYKYIPMYWHKFVKMTTKINIQFHKYSILSFHGD